MRHTKMIQKFTFKPDVDLEQTEGTLLLSIIATEALHGQAAVRLEARYLFSNEKRACVIECRGKVSDDVIQIFTGFLIHEFGEDAFKVVREMHTEQPAADSCSCDGKRDPCVCDERDKSKGVA
jgi:hypothetical protein